MRSDVVHVKPSRYATRAGRLRSRKLEKVVADIGKGAGHGFWKVGQRLVAWLSRGVGLVVGANKKRPQYGNRGKSRRCRLSRSANQRTGVGGYMTEFAFFHRASRTLVLTDLISNFESEKVNLMFRRLLTWVGGISPPYGGMGRDIRLSFTWRHKDELRTAVKTMLSWNPERVIFAHGRSYDTDGTAALKRAFCWLLG